MQIHDTLRHYAWIIRQRLALILLGIVLTSSITYVISLSIQPVYRAYAYIKVNGSPTSTTNDVFSNQALAVSYALFVTDPEVLQATADKLTGISANQLSKEVSDSTVNNTQVIEVRAQANNPQRAADIANTLADTFIQLQITKETAHIQDAVDRLSQNLTQTKLDINTTQQQLDTLQNSHGDDTKIEQQKSILDVEQANYNSLLAGYNRLQTQKLQAATILNIARVATAPDKPDSPQIILNTALAASFSLVLMILLVLLLDWLDITIKTTDDVVLLAGLEPLGGVPLSTSVKLSSHLVDLSIESTDAVREAFAMLGTRFQVLNKGQSTILVTSLRSTIGTTTTATHLALSLARSGLRVLLIDANLRRPLQHTIFQRPNISGLVNSINDVHLFQDQPHKFPLAWLGQWKTQIPNLWLLPSGPSPTHPAALLRAPELRLLKEWLLGQHFTPSNQKPSALIDIIIFDTTSLQEGTDTQALTTIADATVLVIEAGKTQKDDLISTRIRLQRLGAPIIGVVVNRQKASHRTYFYTDQHPLNDAHITMPLPVLRVEGPSPLKVHNTNPETPVATPRVSKLLSGSQAPVREKKPINFSSRELPPLPTQRHFPDTPLPEKKPANTLPLPPFPPLHPTMGATQIVQIADIHTNPPRMQFNPLLRTSGSSYQGIDEEQKL